MRGITFLIINLLLLTSCGQHKSTPTRNVFAELQQRRDFYVQQIESLDDKSVVFTKPCDRLTFQALYSAFGIKQDLSGFEVESGHWVRRVPACYPHESRSTISRDSYIMMMHNWWTHNDLDAVVRSIEYAEDNYFTVGKGESLDLINIAPLMPIMWRIEERLQLTGIIEENLTGFKGHLLFMYIYLASRVEGHLTNIKLDLLEELVDHNPENLLYWALFNRYSGRDQTGVINKALEIFPADHLPTDEAIWGWGSSPDAVTFILLVAILEGK